MILLFKNGAAAGAQQVLGNRRRRRALGRARKRARPNLAGCGEVTSPLFSITSILNATWYYSASGKALTFKCFNVLRAGMNGVGD